MEVYRISHKKHSKALSSSGAANRWNLDGEYVIYTGASRSLSTLELVVHRNTIKKLPDYELMILSIADEEDLFEQVPVKNLPNTWRSFESYYKLQLIGSAWYTEQRSLILKVPSAVIPQEYNYIVNSKHPLFTEKVSLIRNEDYFFDDRLFE
ncbi:RES domain-containing protein [Subsaximicrobium wynnwilliamsii]|jgi:RES domain-containing protein|uniref:RES domain-containing protein n=1 Tax=Subsaximicrobium wynnwilliamsii TaxID=291179 RepID=A0A5C6ZFH8_9FLAO|nr:RES family NAD+ phosphorylase [Subsaximicrobium wynnwilliamsii]TXD82892.1 RES domain-containing protein [Subsaximicrobium wynnwilliamsii]TXD88614.1 RES domain-containing protein [Subsaximicrobium wynnwilliamsii]TXE02706.1 RES domain-containing protein [Subsaximicrobium wynnwilliamsii]